MDPILPQPNSKFPHYHFTILLGVAVSSIFFSIWAAAGTLTPSGAPGGTMRTLQEIYDSIAGTTFDSSSISGDQNGSLIEGIKYINENLDNLSVSSDSLDFDEFVDTMTLDANTHIASAGFAFTVGGKMSVATSSTDFGVFTAVQEAGTSDRQFVLGDAFGDISVYRKRPSWPCCNIFVGGLSAYGSLNSQPFSTSNPAAYISFLTDAAWGGTGAVPTAIRFLTASNGKSALSERMRITSGGNIGINVGLNAANNANAVDAQLEIRASTSFTTANVASISAMSLTTGDVLAIHVPTSASFSGNILRAFDTDGRTLASISAAGNLEIAGYASLSQTLFVQKSGNVSIASSSFTDRLSVEGNGRFSGHVGIGNHGGVNKGLYYGQFGYTDATTLAVNEIVNTTTTDNVFGISNNLRIGLSGASSVYFVGDGNYVEVDNTHTGTIDNVYGIENVAFNNSNSTVTNLFGTLSIVANTGTSGNITNAYAVYGASNHSGGGTVANSYVFFGGAPQSGPTVTNRYGLYLENQTAAGISNAWNVYSDGATSRNYFAGSVGIGTATPGVAAHVYSSSDTDILRLQDSDGTCNHNPEAGSETVTCSSDERLKTDITDASPALSGLNGFRIREYTVKASGGRMTGVIAQEALLTHPDSVSSGSNGYLMVEQPSIWQVIKGIQELSSRTMGMEEALLKQGIVPSRSGALAVIIDGLKDSILSVKELMVERFRAKSVRTEQLELVGDDGSVHCVRIVANSLQSAEGECGNP